MATTRTIELPGTPRPWMNSAMRTMLRMPGLRRWLGRTFAVITVTGSRTGRRYTTPVQYFRDGDRYLVLSQRRRRWWRNIRSRPDVELLVRGEVIRAGATIADGEAARALLAMCLEQNPRVAKFYGIAVDDAGSVPPESVDELLEHLVVISIGPEA